MPDLLPDMLFAVIKNKGLKRLSAFNRLLSFMAVKASSREIAYLHKDLENILEEYHKEWPYHDYGEGYFYQGYPPLLIRGLRDTEFRFRLYNLDSILNSDMSLLDIGCNTGFLSLMTAKRCAHVDAFDNNPFLIRIAERCRAFEGFRNVAFSCCSFDEFKTDSKYDVVLSLANHYTFDGNMRPRFRDYMEKIRKMMKDGGQLIFESHPGEHKEPFLRQNLHSLNDIFKIRSETIMSSRISVYDTNRIVVWMEVI